MSVTEPTRTGDIRGRATDTFGVREARETKPSFMTTEFWAMLVGVVVLAAIYNAASDLSFTLWRACLLGTILATGYIVSRGLAKSGSRDDRIRDRERDY